MKLLQRVSILSIALALIAFVPPLAATCFSQSIVENLYVTNGAVNATVVSGNTIYIGGDFTSVGPATGSFAGIDGTTGIPDLTLPKVLGKVYAVAPDGAGGWFIGGLFTHVGGIPRNNIAHIKSDKTLDAIWNPNASGAVRALAASGSTVYAGGDFQNIGGQARNYIAALNASTGAATNWNPNANSTVYALVVHTPLLPPTTVYAGGSFTNIGGAARNRIAAIIASTGAATSWNPNATAEVYTLALRITGFQGDLTTIYAGGRFGSIGGQSRFCIAALDPLTGSATSWNPNLNNTVTAVALSGSTVYVGGFFTNIGGQTRNRIAALDVSTGSATSWNPGANDWVRAIVVSGSTVYAGGLFTVIGGQFRDYIAALDRSSGGATSWNPNANDSVYALVVSGSTVYAGGKFTSIGGQFRNNIAALDASTGALTAWNPNAIGGFSPGILALAVSGSTVYVGGQFTVIGGQLRNNIAALDISTGSATAWDPSGE